MRRIVILLLMIFSFLSSFGQIGRLTVPEPKFIITYASDFAVLAKKKKGGSYTWDYYESNQQGSLTWPRWRLSSYSPTDSIDAVTTLPVSWIAYTPPCVISNFENLAVWPTTGDTLKARYFGDSLVLTQSLSTVPDGFIVRGYNFYNYENMVYLRTLDSACLASNFNYGETGIGGLYEPSGFTIPEGYSLYYAGDSTKMYYESYYGVDTTVTNLIPSYVVTTLPDTVNLVQFATIAPKSGLSFVFGQGSPYFADMQTQPALALQKGWDFTYTGGIDSSLVVPSANIGAFFDFTGMLSTIASGMTGSRPSLSNVTSGSTTLGSVNRLDAIELGATAYSYRMGYTKGRKIYSMQLDEETWYYPPRSFIAAVMLGMHNAIEYQGAGGRRTILYGNHYSPTDFRKGIVNPYPAGYSEASLNTVATSFNLSEPDFKVSGTYSDFAVMYHKTPIPDTSTYYIKSGGSYTLDSLGRRRLREDAFSETLLGVNTNFYTEPTSGFPTSYQSQTVYGTPHYVGPDNWEHDVYLAISQQYRHHDMLQMGLKARSVSYGHGGDITFRYPEGIQPYAIIRLETEPYTAEGNGHDIRELGEAGILEYATQTGMLVGGFETWQDGTGSEVYVGRADSPYQTLPAQGSALYGATNRYGRFEVATAAIQGIKAAYSGITIDNNLRYFHFSKYYDSYVNKEILSSGFYNNGRLGLYLLYPFHDATDTTVVTIRLGDSIIKTVDLVGRKPMVFNWEIDATVNPNNMSIQYTNIDGTVIHVKGNIENRNF